MRKIEETNENLFAGASIEKHYANMIYSIAYSKKNENASASDIEKQFEDLLIKMRIEIVDSIISKLKK